MAKCVRGRELPHQGWGGTAVQYRQSTPVLGNLGPVADWRSTYSGPVLDLERQYLKPGKVPVLLATTFGVKM